MAADFPPLYYQSFANARKLNRLDLWQISHNENIKCRYDIEESVRQDFNGGTLAEQCSKRLLAAYGFKRMNWVLAATICQRQKEAFSPIHVKWARDVFYLRSKPDKTREFVVDAPADALDQLVGQCQVAYEQLGLLSVQHCQMNAWSENVAGKVLVLSPDALKEQCWMQQNQLWLADGGFGCSPTAAGRAIFATCLNDGEHARWDRAEFIGVIRDECLPAWAAEKLAQLQPANQSLSGQGGMEMG